MLDDRDMRKKIHAKIEAYHKQKNRRRVLRASVGGATAGVMMALDACVKVVGEPPQALYGVAVDAASQDASDAGQDRSDGGFDAGSVVMYGVPMDAGADHDATADIDAGSVVMYGVPMDAGIDSDASADFDAGSVVMYGVPMDAGVDSDASADFDAGSAVRYGIPLDAG